MDIADFEAALSRGKLVKRVFLFAGKEEFLKERLLGRMVEKLVDPAEVGENVQRLDFAVVGPEAFIERLNSFSFSSSPRLFFLNHPESLAAAARKKLLAPFLEKAIPSDVIVVFTTTSTPTVGELNKALDEQVDKFDFWPPFANQLPAWIQKEARELGGTIAPDAADLLLEKIGDDLRGLVQELGKLVLQAGKGKPITLAMVREGVAYMRQDTVFDLLEAIGRRRAPEAIGLAESLIQKGEAPIKLWFMIQRQVRDFRLFHDLLVDRPDLLKPVAAHLSGILGLTGKSDFKANQERKRLTGLVQESVGEWPPFLKECLNVGGFNQAGGMAAALNYKRDELVRIWPRLLEVEQALKSSVPSVALVLERFLLELIGPKKA